MKQLNDPNINRMVDQLEEVALAFAQLYYDNKIMQKQIEIYNACVNRVQKLTNEPHVFKEAVVCLDKLKQLIKEKPK